VIHTFLRAVDELLRNFYRDKYVGSFGQGELSLEKSLRLCLVPGINMHQSNHMEQDHMSGHQEGKIASGDGKKSSGAGVTETKNTQCGHGSSSKYPSHSEDLHIYAEIEVPRAGDVSGGSSSENPKTIMGLFWDEIVKSNCLT
ncbi:unnamed protein product, partial [Amoebophrya sp. A25]